MVRKLLIIYAVLTSLSAPAFAQKMSTPRKIGIGTASPQGKLHVASDSTTDPFVLVTSHSITGYGLAVSTSGSVGIGATSPVNKLQVQGTAGGAAGIYLNDAAPLANTATLYNSGGNLYWSGTSLTGGGALPAASEGYTLRGNGSSWQATGNLFIKSDGNVGIGTTMNNIYDAIAAPRPLIVSKDDASTTLTGSQAAIVIVNSNTTAQNSAQLNFATLNSAASTIQHTAAIISTIFDSRSGDGTNKYPSGNLAFFTSSGYLVTNGAPVERLRITSTGNVGIGTTGPNAMLEINAGTAVNGVRVVQAGGYNSEGNSGIRIFDAATPAVALQMGADNAGNIGYIQAMQPTTSWVNRPLILQGNGGKVGIGTTNPQAALDVAKANVDVVSGDATLDLRSTDSFAVNKGGSLAFKGKYATDGSYQDFAKVYGFKENAGDGSWAGYLGFATGVTMTERMRIDSAGNVGIGTTNPDETLTVNGAVRVTRNAYNWNTQTSGIIDYYSNNLRITAGAPVSTNNGRTFTTTNNGSNVAAMQILPGGNVGIGTAAPGQMLAVNGTIESISGGVKYPDARTQSAAYIPSVAILSYDLASGGTDAAAVAGAWTTRALNTTVTDLDSITSLSSNQFTLQAGTYLIDAFSTFYSAGGTQMSFKVRLRNITDSTTGIVGATCRLHLASGTSGMGFCPLKGLLTISGAKTFQLQYYSQSGESFGTPASSGEVERYAQVTIQKLK